MTGNADLYMLALLVLACKSLTTGECQSLIIADCEDVRVHFHNSVTALMYEVKLHVAVQSCSHTGIYSCTFNQHFLVKIVESTNIKINI